MIGIRVFLRILLIVTVSVTSAAADVIELTSGQRVEGSLKSATADSIVVESGGQTVVLERRNVRAIFFSPPPQVASTPPAPVSEVIDVLGTLQALTRRSVPHEQYARQLREGRDVIDRYLAQPGGDAALKAAVGAAVSLHELAAAAWQSRFTNSATASAAVGRNPVIDQCAALRQLVAGYPPPDTQENAWRRGVLIEFELPSIWACAGEKLAEAERIAGR